MRDYGDGNFMEMMPNWVPLPSPTVREVFAMLDQTDNGLNPISDVAFQTNQPEQRSSLVDRVSARVGRKIPPLRTENMTPFAAQFRNPTTVPLVTEISPGFSPSILLQSPNNFSYSSQPIPPISLPNDGPPETVENSGNNATTEVFNNNVPYQPMQFDLPPQEGSYVFPTENFAYIPSHESHVDPIGAPLVPPFESEVVDDTDTNKLMSMEDKSKSEEEDKEYSEDEDTDTYEDEDKDDDDSADELEVKPSSPKRGKYVLSNIMAATRATKDPRFTVCMETEEDHPSDGYRWRKYGQKVVKGNPNPRGYYRCIHIGCNVKKLVERGAADVKILVITYTGKHGHPKPATRGSRRSGPRNRSRSSVPAPLAKPPFSSSSAGQDNRLFSYHTALPPQDMIRPFSYPAASATQDMRPYPYPYASAAQDMRPYPYHAASAAQDMRPSSYPYASTTQDMRPFSYPSSALAPQDMRASSYPYASAAQDMRPSSYPAALAPQDMRPHSYPYASAAQGMRPLPPSLNQGVDMTHLYMSGLSKLPSFPVNNQNRGFTEPWVNQNHGFMSQNDAPWVNQNHGFMSQNNAPRTDHVIPDGSGVYKEIMDRLFSNGGV